MLTFRTDTKQNILFITFIGSTSKEKVSEQLPALSKACAGLKENFIIINDISLAKTEDDKDFIMLGQVSKKFIETYKVGHVIRIMGALINKITLLKKIDEKLENINVHYANNRKEALQIASKLKR